MNSTAMKDNIEKRKTINKKTQEVYDLIKKIEQENPENLKKIISIVLHNFSTEKKEIGEILDFYKRSWGRTKNGKRKAYLNKEGFSFDRDYGDNTFYLNTVENECYIKALDVIIKEKDKVNMVISKDTKKEIFKGICEAFETSGIDVGFLSSELEMKKVLEKPIKIRFIDGEREKRFFKLIDFIRADNGGVARILINSSDYENSQESDKEEFDSEGDEHSSESQIRLSDMEETEQAYEEIVCFMDEFKERLEKEDRAMNKFNETLKEKFAKQMILASLKEEDEENKK